MGLHIMNYRAAMIGGTLEVRPNGAQGTMVACTFPMIPAK
jgi:nitrate/nitrite-specific signal transduction histidine kinase